MSKSTERKCATRGKLIALMYSTYTGEYVGYIDFQEVLILKNFIYSFNEDNLAFGIGAIGVTDDGVCIFPMNISAKPDYFAVVDQVVLCEKQIVSQHLSLEKCINEAKEYNATESSQGLGFYGVIDDRGVVVWHINK